MLVLGTSLQFHLYALGVGTFMPDGELTRPGWQIFQHEATVLVGLSEMGTIDNHDMGRHFRVDVTEHPNQSGMVKAMALALAFTVNPQVESIVAGSREDIVQDRIFVGKMDSRAGCNWQHTGHEFAFPGVHYRRIFSGGKAVLLAVLEVDHGVGELAAVAKLFTIFRQELDAAADAGGGAADARVRFVGRRGMGLNMNGQAHGCQPDSCE